MTSQPPTQFKDRAIDKIGKSMGVPNYHASTNHLIEGIIYGLIYIGDGIQQLIQQHQAGSRTDQD